MWLFKMLSLFLILASFQESSYLVEREEQEDEESEELVA